MNHYIVSAVKERLARINEEKAELESYLHKESGQIGVLKPAELTFITYAKKDSFKLWLTNKGIKLKPKDKRYSKFYQRYKTDKKKAN